MVEIFTSDDLTNVINARFAIGNDQCTSGIASSQPISLMETLTDGFLGAYQPNTEFVINRLRANSLVGCLLFSFKSHLKIIATRC